MAAAITWQHKRLGLDTTFVAFDAATCCYRSESPCLQHVAQKLRWTFRLSYHTREAIVNISQGSVLKFGPISDRGQPSSGSRYPQILGLLMYDSVNVGKYFIKHQCIFTYYFHSWVKGGLVIQYWYRTGVIMHPNQWELWYGPKIAVSLEWKNRKALNSYMNILIFNHFQSG